MKREESLLRGVVVALGVVLVVSILLGGCSGEEEATTPKKPPTFGDPCTTNLDCEGSLVCGPDGYCIPEQCTKSADCPEGFSCVFGECRKNTAQDGDAEIADDTDIDKDLLDDTVESNHGPRLVYPDEISFGAVLLGMSAERECTVSNGGDEMLTIWHIDVSGGSQEGEFELVDEVQTPIHLDPGMEFTFRLKYTPMDAGADEGWFGIVSDDPTIEGGQARVHLVSMYKGTPKLTLDKEEINFGVVLVDTQNPPTETVQICNQPEGADDNAVLEVQSISLDDEYNRHFELEVPPLPALIAPRQCIEFSVKFRPRERGVLTENVTIVSNDGNTPGTQTVIPLSGRGAIPDMQIEPGILDFGQVKLNRCAELALTVTSTGEVPMVLRSVELESNCPNTFTITDTPPADLTLNMGDSTSITVKYCPAGRRIDVCLMDVWVTNVEEQTATQPAKVLLQGEGVVGFIEVYPDSIDFGAVEVNHSASQPIELVNSSEVDVEVTGLEFLGPSYAFVIDVARTQVNFPLILEPMQQQIVWVKYEPQAEGSDTCRVRINVVEMGDDSPEVMLSGSGVVPLIEITPQRIEFMNAQVGIPETDQFTLKNLGTAPLEIAEVGLSPYSATAEFNIHSLGVNELLPGGSVPIVVDYTANGIGDDFVWLYVCTNATNANPQSCNGCLCNDPYMRPHAVMMITHAISPQLVVNAGSDEEGVNVQTEPVFLINFGFVMEGHTRGAYVELKNDGFGPLTISEITLDATSQFEITSIDTPNGAELPVDLERTDEVITVHLLFTGSAESGPAMGELTITHNDKDHDQYPNFVVHLKANSGENTEPVAIIKSPPGEPAGDQGRRRIEIPEPEDPPCTGCICKVTVDGTASYDPDEGDSITRYEWRCEPRQGCVWSGVGNPIEEITDIGIKNYGEQTIKLTVYDSNGGQSFETQDSTLIVDCQAYPIAAAVEKDSQMDDISVDIGETVTFDGSFSTDPDGEIAEYYWYVCHIVGGECENEHGFGTGVEQSYTFNEEGDYIVSLVVVDDDGLQSKQRGTVNVHVGYNENLRIKATWTNGGNVDLHYIMPGGYFGSSSDCYSGNPNPDWHYYGYGHPQLVNDSTDGTAPEEIYHPDPGDGQYNLIVYYKDVPEDCGYHQECTYVERDCDNCGCRCFPIFCIFGSLCCNDCNVCHDVYSCEYLPAQVVIRFYVNDSLTPASTEFVELVPTDIDQHPQFSLTINRAGGRYYFMRR